MELVTSHQTHISVEVIETPTNSRGEVIFNLVIYKDCVVQLDHHSVIGTTKSLMFYTGCHWITQKRNIPQVCDVRMCNKL